MSVNWTEVNERRIGEKTQEILLYCAQKRTDMTPRAFDLARLSFERLLDNISDRNPASSSMIYYLRNSMYAQDKYVAFCSDEQARSLARSIVYNCIGDDLNLYPVTAEKKVLRAKAKSLKECNIPIDEMTALDCIYVVSAIAEGENISKSTIQSVFAWFREIGLTPMQARVYSVLFRKGKPISIRSFPQFSLLSTEYYKAAKELVSQGYIYALPEKMYCITERTIA